MSDFNKVIDLVLKHEGGFVNDPNDPGGVTKYGISKKAFPDLDIKSLTIEDAKSIYYKHYWEPCKANELPEDIRYIHFDTAVNQGLNKAAKILQRAAGVADDGIIGPITLKASQKVTKNLYGAYRLYDYCQIVRHNPNLGIYIGGWSNRVMDILKSKI